MHDREESPMMNIRQSSPCFEEFGKLVGIHTYANPKDAILKAEGIFTGGGNTFVLLKTLYQHDLLAVLREQIFQGLSYLGTSAGSNICGVSINNTNDMPIVYPPSLKQWGFFRLILIRII